MAYFLTLFILISLCISPSPKFVTSFNLEVALNSFFPGCDLYVVSDVEVKFNPAFLDVPPQVTSSLESPQFVLYPASLRLRVPFDTPQCDLSSCFRVATRRFNQCSVSISFLQKGREQLKLISQLLFTPFLAPVRNEMDYFIFITRTESEVDLVLEDRALSVLKFKLGLSAEAVFLTEPEQVTTGKTRCHYCGDGGNGEVVQVPLDSVNGVGDLFPDYSRNGMGHTLRISGPMKIPARYEMERDDNGNWIAKRGLYKFVIECLLTHFNFTWSVHPSPGYGSGRKFPNGSWNGVVGDLIADDADVGAVTTANIARYPYVSFTTPIFYSYITFMIGQPRVTYSWRSIYWPFKIELWLTIVVTLLAVILAYKVIHRVPTSPVEEGDLIVEQDLLYRHLFTYVTFVLVGQSLPYPSSHSARLLTALWLWVAMIICAYYVTAVVGILAFPVLAPQPKTFSELAHSKYKWALDDSSAFMFSLFSTTTNPVLRSLFERRQKEMNIINCLQEVLRSDFACFSWVGSAAYVSHKNLTFIHGQSPLVLANDLTVFVGRGLALQRRSLLQNNFDNVMGYLRDSGQNDKWDLEDLENLRRAKIRWKRRVLKEKGGGGGAAEDDLVPDDGPDLLSLDNLLGIFYLYIIGHLIALVFFGVEICKHFMGRIVPVLNTVKVWMRLYGRAV